MSGHGGDVYRWAQEGNRRVEEILDFSASINPLGPPACVERIVHQAITRLVHYPEPYAEALCRDLAYFHGVEAEQVVAGNGTTELLFLLPRAFECRQVLVPAPSYIDYARAATLAGLEVERLPLRPEEEFQLDLERLERCLQGGELVLLGQPNNPTGRLCNREFLCRLAAARLDDGANFVPARLTGPLTCLAAWLLGMRGMNAWRVLQRDGGKHPSPNAGRAEAAVAGALGVRLGGVSYYAGEASIKPHLATERSSWRRITYWTPTG